MKYTSIIEPYRAWYRLGLKDLWVHRELLGFLVTRDIRVRYKQTLLGVVWAILQPVLTTAIFTVVFSANGPQGGLDVPYPLFALSGLILWFLVSSLVTRAAWALLTNRNLVTKIFVPRLLIVFSSALGGVIELGMSLVVLGSLMLYYSTPVTWHLLWIPYFLIMSIILSLALGTFFAAMNVYFRDVEFVLPFSLQLWMFSSPIFYSAAMVPDRWQMFFYINPLAGLVDGFRSALFGLPFDLERIAVASVIAVVLFFASLLIFGRMENEFADVI